MPTIGQKIEIGFWCICWMLLISLIASTVWKATPWAEADKWAVRHIVRTAEEDPVLLEYVQEIMQDGRITNREYNKFRDLECDLDIQQLLDSL